MDAADTKRKIAEGALALFSALPYESVSVQTICQRCDCARSTFYVYFRDKTDVLRFLLTESFAWPQGAAGRRSLGPVESLLASPRRFLGLQVRLGPRVMRVYFQDMLNGKHGSIFAAHQEHSFSLSALIRRAQQDGLVTTSCPPNELACLSIFTLSHLSMSWACSDGAFDLVDEGLVHLCGLYGLSVQTWRGFWVAAA